MGPERLYEVSSLFVTKTIVAVVIEHLRRERGHAPQPENSRDATEEEDGSACFGKSKLSFQNNRS